jgi:hypothetical protein
VRDALKQAGKRVSAIVIVWCEGWNRNLHQPSVAVLRVGARSLTA